jgi:hypothetical protein
VTLACYVALAYWDRTWFIWLVFVVVFWRVAEVLVWQCEDAARPHAPPDTGCRTHLLFLFLDAVVVVTGIAIMLSHPNRPPDAFSTWVDSLSILSSTVKPFGYSGGWGETQQLSLARSAALYSSALVLQCSWA